MNAEILHSYIDDIDAQIETDLDDNLTESELELISKVSGYED